MKDQQAIHWLKIRVGKMAGCFMEERDKVYELAIRALENQQAAQVQAKHPIQRGKEALKKLREGNGV